MASLPSLDEYVANAPVFFAFGLAPRMNKPKENEEAIKFLDRQMIIPKRVRMRQTIVQLSTSPGRRCVVARPSVAQCTAAQCTAPVTMKNLRFAVSDETQLGVAVLIHHTRLHLNGPWIFVEDTFDLAKMENCARLLKHELARRKT